MLNKLVEKFQDDTNTWRTEGEEGVRNFTKLVNALGYSDSYSDPLHNFLCDNSGAIDAMIEWIKDNRYCDDWEESLKEIVCLEEEIDE